MYKINSGNAPICLQQLCKSNKEVHTHYTRQAQHLHSMKGESKFVYKTFLFQVLSYRTNLLKILTLRYNLFALNTH